MQNFALNSLILRDGSGAHLVGYQLRSKGKSLVLYRCGMGELAYDTGYDLSTKDKIIRVVEVRSHPLGRELETLVVLEIVDRRMDKGSFRCVCLEANKVVNAICSLPINEDYIEVLDAQV